MKRLIRIAGCNMRESPEYVEIKNNCLNGVAGKIASIKAVREFLGCDLLEAKQEVEEKWYPEVGPFTAHPLSIIVTSIKDAEFEFSLPNPFYLGKVFHGSVRVNSPYTDTITPNINQIEVNTSCELPLDWSMVKQVFLSRLESFTNQKGYEWNNNQLVQLLRTIPRLYVWDITPNRIDYIKGCQGPFKTTSHLFWKSKKLEMSISCQSNPNQFLVDVTLPKIHGGGFIKQEICGFNEVYRKLVGFVELGKSFIDQIGKIPDVNPFFNVTPEVGKRLSDLSQLLGADAFYLGKINGYNIYKCKNYKFKWSKGAMGLNHFEIVSCPGLTVEDFKDLVHINRLKKGEKK